VALERVAGSTLKIALRRKLGAVRNICHLIANRNVLLLRKPLSKALAEGLLIHLLHCRAAT